MSTHFDLLCNRFGKEFIHNQLTNNTELIGEILQQLSVYDSTQKSIFIPNTYVSLARYLTLLVQYNCSIEQIRKRKSLKIDLDQIDEIEELSSTQDFLDPQKSAPHNYKHSLLNRIDAIRRSPAYSKQLSNNSSLRQNLLEIDTAITKFGFVYSDDYKRFDRQLSFLVSALNISTPLSSSSSSKAIVVEPNEDIPITTLPTEAAPISSARQLTYSPTTRRSSKRTKHS